MQEILAEAGKYVADLFNDHDDVRLLYHNFHHTCMVVDRAKEIAGNYILDDDQQFVLLLSAWFHDTGHLLSNGEDHETKSVGILQEFLAGKSVPAEIREQVENCILATKLPANPQNLIEKILCDADLYHLGTKEFIVTNNLVRQEIELRNNIHINNWVTASLEFLKSHHFFTGYCRKGLTAGKLKNMVYLEKMCGQAE